MCLDLIYSLLEHRKSEVILFLIKVILAMLHDKVIEELLSIVIFILVQILSFCFGCIGEVENASDNCNDSK